MSNLWFNISLGRWHFQIERGFGRVTLRPNRNVQRPWHRFKVHCAFGHHFD